MPETFFSGRYPNKLCHLPPGEFAAAIPAAASRRQFGYCAIGGTNNELANLELPPSEMNRSRGTKAGERQPDVARQFRKAGLISEAAAAKVQAAYFLIKEAKRVRLFDLRMPRRSGVASSVA